MGPRLGERIDADHIVRGQGIRWMRAFLGEDVARPIPHPVITSALESCILGVRLPRAELEHEAGLLARLAAPLVGRYVLHAMRREHRRLKRGHTYEPPTFYETEALRRLRGGHPVAATARLRRTLAAHGPGLSARPG